MEIQEYIEFLRNEPIRIFSGNPKNIPCVETSDPGVLCKSPIVSINMVTFNHESYICQAIEGVMMQKTDFDFELLIGDDCSTDRTRAICLEYQKKYPERIRILSCDHNLYKEPSPAGDNVIRNSCHCRGEFVAICEGDDFWTDEYKLQKQVNIMRANPSVGLIFSDADQLYQKTGARKHWQADSFPSGLITGREFFRVFGWGPCKHLYKFGPESFIMTASVMLRRNVLEAAKQKYDIFKWALTLRDSTTWLGCASLSDVYYMKDTECVYRIHSSGAMASNGARTLRDGILVRLYFAMQAFGLSRRAAVARFKDVFVVCQLNSVRGLPASEQRRLLDHYLEDEETRSLFLRFRTLPVYLLMKLGLVNAFSALWASRFVMYMPRFGA